MGKYFDITPHLSEIIERLNRGESLRMVASCIGIDHNTLSYKLKAIGYHVPSKTESAKRTWKNHVHPRLGKKGELCPAYGKKMTAATREKLIPTWKKLADKKRLYIKKHSSGYTLVYSPKHPCADHTGYVLEHRIIVETKLGRYLSPDEIVHHKNGIKTDNNIDNLIVISKSEHAKIHNNLGKKIMLNKILITGRLTARPELKTTTSGVSVAAFSVAVQRNYKDKSGEYLTDFINCVAFRKQAEFASNYFDKGQLITVVGSLTSRRYEDSEGNKRTTFEVVAEELLFAESKKTEGTSSVAIPNVAQGGNNMQFEEVEDEELPF